MKIIALSKFNNEQVISNGEIIINWIKESQAYVTWQLFNKNGLIASRSENYFFDKEIDTEKILVGRIINKIENYRIGRKKIFERVELDQQ